MSLVSDMILQDAAREDEERQQDIAKRWAAYYGKLPPPLKVKPGQTDDNLRLNFAGGVVNEGVAFLFGQDIDFVVAANAGHDDGPDDDDSDENPNQAQDDWLEACWKQNKGTTLLQELAINGGVCGDGYLKVMEANTAENPSEYPRLVLVDPGTVSAIWDPHDIKAVLQWVIQWHGIDPATRRPVVYRQLITRDDGGKSWTVVDQHRDDRSSAWATDSTVVWGYEWPPVFHCQNLPAPNQFYGMADLEDDVLESARGINFVASNIGRILRFHAHPKTWGVGFTAKQLEIGVDGTIILPNKEATLQNLEMQSDLSSSLAFYEKMLEAFYAVSRTPEITTGNVGEGLGTLSGIALQVLYGPLLRKNNTKRRLYGDMLCDLSARLLEMSGQGADLPVSITWPDPLPADKLVQRQAALIDQQLGVSKATVLESLGYDAKAEAKRKSEEDQDLGTQLLTGFDRGTNTGQPNTGRPAPAASQGTKE